jgi:hypothetical protein
MIRSTLLGNSGQTIAAITEQIGYDQRTRLPGFKRPFECLRQLPSGAPRGAAAGELGRDHKIAA